MCEQNHVLKIEPGGKKSLPETHGRTRVYSCPVGLWEGRGRFDLKNKRSQAPELSRKLRAARLQVARLPPSQKPAGGRGFLLLPWVYGREGAVSREGRGFFGREGADPRCKAPLGGDTNRGAIIIPRIVDFWGLCGPGGPRHHSKMSGAPVTTSQTEPPLLEWFLGPPQNTEFSVLIWPPLSVPPPRAGI